LDRGEWLSLTLCYRQHRRSGARLAVSGEIVSDRAGLENLWAHPSPTRHGPRVLQSQAQTEHLAGVTAVASPYSSSSPFTSADGFVSSMSPSAGQSGSFSSAYQASAPAASSPSTPSHYQQHGRSSQLSRLAHANGAHAAASPNRFDSPLQRTNTPGGLDVFSLNSVQSQSLFTPQRGAEATDGFLVTPATLGAATATRSSSFSPSVGPATSTTPSTTALPSLLSTFALPALSYRAKYVPYLSCRSSKEVLVLRNSPALFDISASQLSTSTVGDSDELGDAYNKIAWEVWGYSLGRTFSSMMQLLMFE